MDFQSTFEVSIHCELGSEIYKSGHYSQQPLSSPKLELVVNTSQDDQISIVKESQNNALKQTEVEPLADQEILESIEQHYFSDSNFDPCEHVLRKTQRLRNSRPSEPMQDCIKVPGDILSKESHEQEGLSPNRNHHPTESIHHAQHRHQSPGWILLQMDKTKRHLRPVYTTPAPTSRNAELVKIYQLQPRPSQDKDDHETQRTDERLQELLNEGDYPSAIRLLLECQNAAATYKHFTCVAALSGKLQDTLEMAEEQLDQALSQEHLKSVTDNEVCSLLNLGTCGLHVVHGSLRTGVESVDWDISSLLRHMYYLFTDSPARRALFTQLTGCTTFPLKFCGVRWLENAKCFQRALQIWDHVIKFLKEAKLPKTKPVETLKRAACDPFLKCKLAFCKTIADECQPFLQRFQTSKPMTPYLFEAVEKLLRYLMNRCVKPDLMKCTGPKLLSIDTKKSENLILSKNIDIGFATKRLLGETAITVTERQKLEFIHECRSMLTTMIAKLQEKSPLKQKAVRGLSSLDPCVIQHSPQLAQKRFSFLLEELNHANIINDVLAENAKKEYLHFCNLKKSELQEIFRPCDQFSDEVGLDTIYGSFLIGEANYKHLWEVIKICLVLSHGNATVEGGFSVNKSLLVENMHEKTVIAQRHIHDEIQEAGGIKNIHISKKMLDYVRGARKRYHEYLEMKKQEKSEKDKKKAEKRKLDIQVKDLEGERKKLMMATEEKREAIDVELQELKKKQASLY
uniref:Vacuolar protein sorting-associated protein 54 N-terminal domain-containing protein n=1 Tax=Timema cristinae TaxID=61476 RepID=A0A7R9CD83_TIMCR|nr:unnamed protein product [Timema cristinae]